MNRTECARELIARYIGVETGTEQVKLKVLLDLYADAVLLDAKDAEREEILRCAQNDSVTEEKAAIPQSAAPTAPFTQGSHEKCVAIAKKKGIPQPPAAAAPFDKGAMKGNGKDSTHTHTNSEGGRGAAGRAAVTQYAEEKKAIHARLKTFREENGLGCFEKIVVAANGTLTDEDVRNMYEMRRMPIAKWKILNGTLAYLNGGK